jgi:uncharacterized membrane protein
MNRRLIAFSLLCAVVALPVAAQVAVAEVNPGLLPLLMRWAHVISAVVAVGGSFFIWLVLLPVAGRVLAAEQAGELRAALTKRWAKFVHTCILLFLVSGFYNYLVVTGPRHEGNGQYHMLFGIKFLLALVVFVLAVILTSSKPWSAKFKQNPIFLTLLVVTSLIVVMLGGYMKLMP